MNKQEFLDKCNEYYDYYKEQPKDTLIIKMFKLQTEEASIDSMIQICVLCVLVDTDKEKEDE